MTLMLLLPLRCALCSTVWDRLEMINPSCSHSEQEWAQHREALGNDHMSQRRWIPVET